MAVRKFHIAIGISTLLCAVLINTFQAQALLAPSDTVNPPAKEDISTCGNNIREGYEQCDGKDITTATCNDLGYFEGTPVCGASCEIKGCFNSMKSTCGNKILEWDEECEDGNTKDGDGCSAQCGKESTTIIQAAICGNKVLESGEQCEDGNILGGDGCSATCTKEASKVQGKVASSKPIIYEQSDDVLQDQVDVLSERVDAIEETVKDTLMASVIQPYILEHSNLLSAKINPDRSNSDLYTMSSILDMGATSSKNTNWFDLSLVAFGLISFYSILLFFHLKSSARSFQRIFER